MKKSITIGGEKIGLGQRKTINLKVAKLYDFTELEMPVHVIRGKLPGPTLFLSAAIHGDEINGIEIIREVLASKKLDKLKGTLIAVPIVNIFGFNYKSRYLPDRRDLNRSFPGSMEGSLASRMAKIFMKEIVSKCEYGIDFHTAAVNRENLPQIRACLDDDKTTDFAKSFGAPFMLNSKLRDGSLREAARKKKVTTLVFEGGEALRFNHNVIKIGVKGCFSAMASIGMLAKKKTAAYKGHIAKNSYWVRSSSSGTLRTRIVMGAFVEQGQKLGRVLDPLGGNFEDVLCPIDGYIVGVNNLPLVTQGEALFHIATNETLKSKHLKSKKLMVANLLDIAYDE